MIYASGKHARGQCRRCGFDFKLSELRPDGDTNLLVCRECYDIPHPAKRPIDTSEGIALRNPAKDLDEEASRYTPPEFDKTVVEALGWAEGTYFGGGT